MTKRDFIDMMCGNFGFPPTGDQQHAFEVFTDFIGCQRGMHSTGSAGLPAMILRGSAGTGKTSIVAAMVKTLLSLKQKVVLLAPTGRAAKVLSLNCERPATTIHRKIYRQKKIEGDFTLDVNLHVDTLFVVDEASMISTQQQAPSLSGEGGERGWMPQFIGNGGGVIDDLVTYVYSGNNCRMMLVGDAAQLPPVGEDEAPALQRSVIECYGLSTYECDLKEVVRQQQESGILWNATMLRQLITHDRLPPYGGGQGERLLPKIWFKGFADIKVLPGMELIEELSDSYYRVGEDDTVVITRSNKRATIYNNGIRARVVDHEGELCSGDRIMVVKNHYFDLPDEEMRQLPFSFIANGDMAVVRRVRNVRELYGFRFADLTLQFPDYDDYEMQLTALLDVLQTDAPALTAEQHQRLFNAVMEDYADIPYKADRMAKLKQDIYYNALQIKFAYAITCHKAQGGQWSHVYIDQGYMTDDMLTPDYIHWLYTAFTRATEQLYLVNWPKEQIGRLRTEETAS